MSNDRKARPIDRIDRLVPLTDARAIERRSATPRAMPGASPRAAAGVGARRIVRSCGASHERDGARRTRVERGECAHTRGRCVARASSESRARRRVLARGLDVGVAVDAARCFIADPSPGLVRAAAANTTVFTTGFGALRLGLTLAGIAHSWFLGTVRRVVAIE